MTSLFSMLLLSFWTNLHFYKHALPRKSLFTQFSSPSWFICGLILWNKSIVLKSQSELCLSQCNQAWWPWAPPTRPWSWLPHWHHDCKYRLHAGIKCQCIFSQTCIFWYAQSRFFLMWERFLFSYLTDAEIASGDNMLFHTVLHLWVRYSDPKRVEHSCIINRMAFMRLGTCHEMTRLHILLGAS